MRVVIQRVDGAVARRSDIVIEQIGRGLVLFVGFAPQDGESTLTRLAGKISRLRLFDDNESRFARSILDIAGQALTVPQFTLFADVTRGAKPSFSRNAELNVARTLYLRFGEALREAGVARVRQCPFAARLHLEQQHWGPCTLVLDG